jgi:hypothetical protein
MGLHDLLQGYLYHYLYGQTQNVATNVTVAERIFGRMASSGMLRRVALVRTDVSVQLSASFIRVTIGELGATVSISSQRALVASYS